MLRSGAKKAIEEAISRGVKIKVVASIDKKTIRIIEKNEKKNA